MSRIPGATSPVTVGWYLHPIEASIARMALETEGIPAFLDIVNSSCLAWPITLALGGVRLQVPPSEASRAAAILATHTEPDTVPEPEMHCPACGNAETKWDRLGWHVAFLLIHIPKIPVPFSNWMQRCPACGHVWKVRA